LQAQNAPPTSTEIHQNPLLSTGFAVSFAVKDDREKALLELYWLFGTSIPKLGRESSLFHIATIHNSRQAYASFLNSRQFYGVRGHKISHFSLLTSCLKEALRGKVMSAEAAQK
jgi:hypothetical protein